MNLSEVLPQKVQLKLIRLDQPLYINMITLDDNQWLSEQYPGDELKKVYSEPRVKDILRITCRLLDQDSKRYLAKVKIIEFDEEGNEKILEGLTLAEKLYKLAADSEIGVIIMATYDVKRKSNEMIEQIKEKANPQKKTLISKEMIQETKEVSEMNQSGE